MRCLCLAAPGGMAARVALVLIFFTLTLVPVGYASSTAARGVPRAASPGATSSLPPPTARIAPATSTTSTTTTTLPMWPPPCGETGMDGRVTATDALYVLKAALGLEACFACLCDADDSGAITATDALRVLRYAVGLPVVMSCPSCAPAVCGDDIVNQPSEECDGTSDAACPGRCQSNCRCAQPVCGDNAVNQPSEECDGTDDRACPTLCQGNCTCPPPFCGDNVKQQGEVCDGTDLSNQTCNTLGFGGGTLICLTGCDGFDTAGCTLPAELPPDPASIAPAVDQTKASDAKSATEFLYTGSNPVQYGVLPETIEKRRAALLRGLVKQRDGSPLGGVEVRLPDHPELGATQTRADGRFDLVVNGGGAVTLSYQKAGYLRITRRVDVPWQQYVVAADVTMIPLDPAVATIDLTAAVPVQVARGSTVNDSRGTRQSALLIPQGTSAEIVLPDGSTQALTTLSIRQTEYTVGDTGPEAMPGELPRGVGYTYAAELSVDEALAAGAKTVRFSQPIVNYVDNFLGFPVGSAVPTYYYDQDAAAWVAMPDGVVIKIVAIASGSADIDTDGDDVADDAATLAALGITAAERERLASLYSAGTSLWRTQTAHFSPVDYNWPISLPPDAAPPEQPPPAAQTQSISDDCDADGSVIECLGQTLGERVPLAGLPFALNYRSNRTSGYKAAYALDIPLTGDSPSGGLLGVRLVIDIAGQHVAKFFAAGAGQTYRFLWNGKDAYGRPLSGQQAIRVRLGYMYPTNYGCGGGGGGGSACPPALPLTMWSEWQGSLGAIEARTWAIGGWSLDVHHTYDPLGRILYKGDGSRRSASSVSSIIDAYAGSGQPWWGETDVGDGGPATQALIAPHSLASGPDGSLYIADNTHRIRRVDPDGIITTVAGNGSSGDVCDGSLATTVSIDTPEGLAVASDGTIYASIGRRVCKIDRSGRITAFAGDGSYGFGGDGGPAIQAQFGFPGPLAIGPSGDLYIADVDSQARTVRRVDRAGIITRVAGNGVWPPPPSSDPSLDDGIPATSAYLCEPRAIAVSPDGSLYIAETCGQRIRMVRPDGIITTVAGRYFVRGATGEGGPAASALLNYPWRLAIGTDGALYGADNGRESPGKIDYRIFRIGHDGMLTRLAGSQYDSGPGVGDKGDGGPAIAAELGGVNGLGAGPDGSIYVSVALYRPRVRVIRPLLPGVSTLDDIVIVARDGRRGYVFDSSGRHLRTVSTLTGAILYRFTYDGNGLLAAVTDAGGNVTTIERDGSGNPTAIVAPGGQRTTVTVDAGGYLSSVTNPAGETTAFTYAGGGLLATMTDAEGDAASFIYDADGLLIRDDDAAGGAQTLVRADLAGGFEVARATTSSATTTYRFEPLAAGGRQFTNVFPDGTQSQVVVGEDAGQAITMRDATTVDLGYEPDPRFGMQAPLITSLSVKTPSGLTFDAQATRTATLADPSDQLSLTELVETTTVASQSWEQRYDAASRRWTVTSPAGRQQTRVVDATGRAVQVAPPGLDPFALGYDSSGRLVSLDWGSAPNVRQVTLAYGSAGWLASVTDPLGQTTELAHDGAGRLTARTLPDGRTVAYSYDRRGEPTQVTLPSGNAYQMTYTPLGRIATVDLPQVGTATGRTSFSYDGDRRLSAVARPDGTTVDLRYDGGGHLAQVVMPSATWSYTYDASTGHLASLATPEVTTDLTRDGILPASSAWSGAITGTVDVAYDSNLRVASRSINGSDTVSFAYDGDGLETGAGSLAITRDGQSGLPTGTTLAGVTDAITVSGFGEPSQYQVSFGGSDLYAVQYTRNAIGRITSKTETIGGVTDTYEYFYDAAGQLTEVRENGTTVDVAAYDADGNRTNDGSGGATVTSTYDARDRLLARGTVSYSYAPTGELTGKTDSATSETTAYTYDALGNLTAVVLPDSTAIDYVIDAAGRRVGKKTGGTLVQSFLYKDRLHPVAELDGSGTVVSRFVYVGQANTPAYMVKGGVEYRIVSDHLGSVRLVVDAATGAVAQRIDYDAWGVVTLDTNPGFQPFGFAGGLYDPDTGLLRFGYRDYDASTGRWTAPDPLRFAGHTVNLYSYVFNDPVNLIDPWGLACPPSFWGQVLHNIETTNRYMMTGAARFGITAATGAAGTVASAVGGVTVGQAASAVLSVGGPAASEAAIAVGSTAAVTAAVVAGALEAGIVVGSIINVALF